MKFTKGKQKSPWIGVIYGVPGVGKSTLGQYAPDPLYIDTEGGIHQLDVMKTESQVKRFEDLMESLREALKTEAKTIVIDTLSGVEEILTNKLLDEHAARLGMPRADSLADKAQFPYGAGYDALKGQFTHFAKVLFECKARGKNVLCIAHEQIEKVENPSGDNYDRHTLNIHKKSIPLIIGKMDFVGFMQYEKDYRLKSGSDKKIAIDTGNRILCTMEKPFYTAKNRFGLPEIMLVNTPDEIREFFNGLDSKEV